MKKCKKCKFWIEQSANSGICSKNKLKESITVDTFDDGTIYERYIAFMYTSAEFGCIYFKKKKQKTQGELMHDVIYGAKIVTV